MTTLEQVGLPPDVVDQAVATLSGGQQARADLAAVLLARFDIMLLDEPTNDLDFEGLARLEELVTRRSGGLVIVSHDRAFLERTVTEVVELDEHAFGPALRRRLGGLPGRARRPSRPTPPRPTPSTSPSAPSCAAGPNASANGPRPASAREKKQSAGQRQGAEGLPHQPD